MERTGESAARRFGRMLRLPVRLAVLWLAGSVLSVLLLRFLPPFASSVQVYDGWSRLVRGESPMLDVRWRPYGGISDHAKLAVIAAEDQKFATHYGFDLESVAEALERHQRRGRRLRGASTITQQVAKNLFLWPERSWLRKGVEAYYTALLEALWPKQRILEMYLNVAELGDGIYGVEAASRRFYDRGAERLTGEQGSLLAAVLPNPHRLRADRPSSYVRRRAAWVRGQMSALGGPAHLRQFEGRWY